MVFAFIGLALHSLFLTLSEVPPPLVDLDAGDLKYVSEAAEVLILPIRFLLVLMLKNS